MEGGEGKEKVWRSKTRLRWRRREMENKKKRLGAKIRKMRQGRKEDRFGNAYKRCN